MILLLVCVLTLGKIVGQQILVPQYVGTQPIPVLTPAAREFNRVVVVPSLQRFQNSAAAINQLLNDNGSGHNLNLPQQVAVRDNQPRRDFFVPSGVADTMDVRRPLTQEAKIGVTDSSTNPKAGDGSDVYDNFYIDDNVTANEPSDVNYLPATPFSLPRPTVSTRDRPVPNPSRTTTLAPIPITPQNVTGKDVNITHITFDQRASFDGNKCPSGYVRVNGSSDCIKPD